MQHEAEIDRASLQLHEIAALMRSRGDQMNNDVLDILIRWNDTRSQDFARTDLVQLMECRDQALNTARACLEISEAARDEIARAEQMLLQTIPLYEELVRLVQSVNHDARRAQDFAARATHEAREGQFLAQQAVRQLTTLGDP